MAAQARSWLKRHGASLHRYGREIVSVSAPSAGLTRRSSLDGRVEPDHGEWRNDALPIGGAILHDVVSGAIARFFAAAFASFSTSRTGFRRMPRGSSPALRRSRCSRSHSLRPPARSRHRHSRGRPAMASAIKPECAGSITSFQIAVGIEPPVIFLVGELSSLPTHTPATR